MARSLRSANEDFSGTLSKLSNALARLAFVCSLRKTRTRYRHWGLTRTHGERDAQQALAEGHSSALIALLRTSVRDLWQLVRRREPSVVHIQELEQKRPKMLVPADLKGGSPWHLRASIITVHEMEESVSENSNEMPKSPDQEDRNSPSILPAKRPAGPNASK